MIRTVRHAPEEIKVQPVEAVEDESLRRETEAIVREAGNDSVEEFPSEKTVPVTVLLGRTPEENVYDDDIFSGVRGFTRSIDTIEITYTARDGFEDQLRGIVPHEYTHTSFIEERAGTNKDELGWERMLEIAIPTNWWNILFEAQSQAFAEQMYPGIAKPQRDSVDETTLKNTWWSRVRDEKLDEPAEPYSPLFIGTREENEDRADYDYPSHLGYTLSYHIGQQLLGEDDIGIADFPHLSREDVVRAGNALYG